LNLLLDTHVLIWWALGEPITEAAREAISAPENQVVVSAASIWEAEIKVTTGKLKLDIDLAGSARERALTELAISFEHAAEAARLPQHHRDPFDRMLVAQARLEGLTLVTRDPDFEAYDVKLMPA
jgi:PIN domain nuclease of toxin-antitoxin system